MNIVTQHRRRVVVLGAGFGGLTFCKNFECPNAEIILVDRQNHHLFQPLLYQVATAGLSAPEIAQPIRSILRHRPDVTVLLRDVTDINLSRREVHFGETSQGYDYLVLALGGVSSYFGHPEWERFAPGLKSLDDALRIRREVLLAFEHAENSGDAAERRRLMTIVVIGGGPTGVELAGAFAELTRRVLRRDFRRIDPREARVVLVEAGPQILPQFSPRLSSKAVEQLMALGAEVRTNIRVDEIGDSFLRLSDGTQLESANMIWAAGVAANPIAKQLGVQLDRAGRIRVNPDLSVPGHPEAFAIGDLAVFQDENGRAVPGVSPAAMQMAHHASRIVSLECRSGKVDVQTRPAFKYWNKGNMATIGRSSAMTQIGRMEFSGWPAWVAWLLTHLVFLIGFRNKAAVLLQWTYSYFTYKLGSRIVTGLGKSEGAISNRTAGNDSNTTTKKHYDHNQTSLRTR